MFDTTIFAADCMFAGQKQNISKVIVAIHTDVAIFFQLHFPLVFTL